MAGRGWQDLNCRAWANEATPLFERLCPTMTNQKPALRHITPQSTGLRSNHSAGLLAEPAAASAEAFARFSAKRTEMIEPS